MAFVTALFLLFLVGVNCDLQDMTWVMDENKISFFPVYDTPEMRFSYKKQQAGPILGFKFVAFNSYSTVEHMGTHMDAPYHANENGLTMDEVPLADLMGPLVKIDISERAAQTGDAEITIEDVLKWEDKHGKIPDRSYVLMSSGWDKYYGDNAKYFGTSLENLKNSGGSQDPDHNNFNDLHFPGFTGSATEWLIDNRNILGIGVDTISCDPGKDINFSAHAASLSKNKVCVENLKNVDKVPECGARFMMLPIMMKGGTGTQGRAFAEWYSGVGYQTTCKDSVKRIDSFFETGKANFAFPSVLLLVVSTLFSFLKLY